MDHPPPDTAKPPATAAEQEAACAVAAEESARQRAWRETARSSTAVMTKPVRRNRLLLPILTISSILSALTCALLLQQLQQMHRLETPGSPTPRHTASTTRAPLPPQHPASPIAPAPPPAPITADAPHPTPTSAPPPSPLVITIPAPNPPAPPAEPPPPTASLSAEERRQVQLYERRLVAGTDLLSRDLTEREQTIARLQRRLTFEPGRQPPLGAMEELAEALRYSEGAVGDERERLTVMVNNRRTEVANLQRQLLHDQEVAESLRRRLDNARQELDGVRKKLGPPP